ncbi:LysE family translocator [Photobacterium swingsii]|uniref:LysE family translocator n=1 Tax=Photobacterium swingsii TaxID=680026 RepID=UPI003D130884
MEFLSLAALGILIVISPGADFVLVLKNSLNQGRQAGIWTAAGVSAAICVHIGYSMLGISYLISQNEVLFNLVRYCGAAYLIYIGVKSIITAKADVGSLTESHKNQSNRQHFIQGFLCNVLNPKTMLFFLSIFSQVIALDTGSSHTALMYGIYMIALHGLWFSIVAVVFTSPVFQKQLLKMKNKLNQACGVGLVSFGVMLAAK